MKTQIEITAKTTYLEPKIVQIKLDNEISLILESEPPIGPHEACLMTNECRNNNPFTTT